MLGSNVPECGIVLRVESLHVNNQSLESLFIFIPTDTKISTETDTLTLLLFGLNIFYCLPTSLKLSTGSLLLFYPTEDQEKVYMQEHTSDEGENRSAVVTYWQIETTDKKLNG